jgi:hypothetical protein
MDFHHDVAPRLMPPDAGRPEVIGVYAGKATSRRRNRVIRKLPATGPSDPRRRWCDELCDGLHRGALVHGGPLDPLNASGSVIVCTAAADQLARPSRSEER